MRIEQCTPNVSGFPFLQIKNFLMNRLFYGKMEEWSRQHFLVIVTFSNIRSTELLDALQWDMLEVRCKKQKAVLMFKS